VYLDSSALVCLYVQEAGSETVTRYLESLRRVVPLNFLQDFEIRNAIRQKVFRQEIPEGKAVAALRVFDDDIVAGRITRKPVDWPAAFEKAEDLSLRHALRRHARAFDLVHVAIALISDVRELITGDSTQAEIARLAGLRVVQIGSQPLETET
jgi:predicted nucleic acid-binding protein